MNPDSRYWGGFCAVIFGLGLWAANDLGAWLDSWRQALAVQAPAQQRCK